MSTVHMSMSSLLLFCTGFVTLANHIPSHLRSKKMSKVDTLRAALNYIQDLQESLERFDSRNASPAESPNSSTSSLSSPQAATFSHPAASYTPTTCYQTAPYQQREYGETPQYRSHQTCSGFVSRYNSANSDTCPSPTSSCSSGYQEQITPEVEAEILEFASWFQTNR